MEDFASPPRATRYQICFRPACLQNRCVAFPCDERGVVDLDGLSEAGRRQYLFARIVTRVEHVHPELVAVAQ